MSGLISVRHTASDFRSLSPLPVPGSSLECTCLWQERGFCHIGYLKPQSPLLNDIIARWGQSTHLGDRARFMVAPDQLNPLRIAEFQAREKGDRLDRM